MNCRPIFFIEETVASSLKVLINCSIAIRVDELNKYQELVNVINFYRLYIYKNEISKQSCLRFGVLMPYASYSNLRMIANKSVLQRFR